MPLLLHVGDVSETLSLTSEARQRCSSGRSLSRSVLNPLPDLPGAGGSGLVLPHHLPEERDCETFRVAASPVRSGRGVARWNLPRRAGC
eukprot:jgi/Tetstr1/458659/TSEL_045052.t3